MSRRINADMLLGGLSLAVSVVFLWISYRDNAGVFVLPGDAPPFLVPQIYLYVWIALSIGIFIGGVINNKNDDFPAVYYARLFTTIVWVCLCAAIMPFLGFLIAGTLGTAGVCWLLGARRWWIILLVALLASIGIESLLTGFANLPLPPIPGMRF